MNMEDPDPGSKISSSSALTDGKLKERRVATVPSCPNCGHEIDCNTDMIGMPAGVKFDPSDQELIHHLQKMVDEGGSRAHPLIDEFIPTIQGENGICYTHPENLPGVRRDGLSKHFFHRSSKAYTNGTRKRRKIHSQRDRNTNSSDNVTEMRWHKTGKTRPVIVGGRQKGCKKILVLYTNFGKKRKPEKTNWVMHQYHLGDQEEKDGELVVSKIFYQTQRRQHVAAAMAATVQPHMMEGGKAAETTSGAMQDVLCGFAAANTTSAVVTIQHRQQQRTNQTDGQISVAHHSKKRCHEEKQQHKEVGRMSASLEELIKGASADSETQRPYRFWPPDRIQNQNG